jgi:hypothetical protein
MDAHGLPERLREAVRPLGDGTCALCLGRWWFRIEGLDEGLRGALERRWGGFLRRATPGPARATVSLVEGGAAHWLAAPRRGEVYRIEAVDGIIASYHFAIAAGEPPGSWRLAVTRTPDEPLERIVDNALRLVTALVAVEEGGFAMHAAGVLREGRAFLFAGPSRAGKSTVVRLLAPARAIGDDFALVVPGERGWCAPALPFDNSERAPADPPEGTFPVAGIWRLHRDRQTGSRRPPAGRAVASLMSCVAFPWIAPERAAALLAQVERFVREGRFRHLHFTREANLWPHLQPPAGE